MPGSLHGDLGRASALVKSCPYSEAVQPSLAVPGSLLAGRYRLVDALDERVPGGQRAAAGPTSVQVGQLPVAGHWRARDELLGRSVALHLVPDDDAASAVLRGARAAARIPGAAVIRVLDVLGTEHLDEGSRDLAGLVITEWVPGETLETVLLRDGSLPDPDVRGIALAVAEALACVDELGDPALPVPPLTPTDVRVTPDGGVRIALDRHWAGETHAAVVTRTGAVAYAALTARWPLADAVALPPAPLAETGHTCTPRQVRAHVDPELDELVGACLELTEREPFGPGDVAARFRALEFPVQPEPPDEPPGARRWLLPAVVGSVLAVGFGMLAFQVTRAVQEDPGGPRREAVRPSAAAPPAVVATPGPLTIRAAVGFDPQGDGIEGDGALALDGDAGTTWRTASYYRRADLGGLKSGVGLLLDLGAVQVVRTVEVDQELAGTSLEVHVLQQEPRGAPEGEPDARMAAAPQQAVLTVPTGTRGRWVLLWATELPPAPGEPETYRTEVREVRVLGRTA